MILQSTAKIWTMSIVKHSTHHTLGAACSVQRCQPPAVLGIYTSAI